MNANKEIISTEETEKLEEKIVLDSRSNKILKIHEGMTNIDFASAVDRLAQYVNIAEIVSTIEKGVEYVVQIPIQYQKQYETGEYFINQNKTTGIEWPTLMRKAETGQYRFVDNLPIEQEEMCIRDREKIESKKYGISVDNMDVEGDYRISYISDLHLLHRIKHAECESKEDIYYLIYKIADNIVKESDEIILIVGDVSSTFSIFRFFVKRLRKIADQSYVKKEFVFVLGNHELWNFPELSLNQIVEKYRNFLEEYDMYLLHNDLMYKDNKNETNIISYNKLMHFKDSNIIEKLKSSRMVIFCLLYTSRCV